MRTFVFVVFVVFIFIEYVDSFEEKCEVDYWSKCEKKNSICLGGKCQCIFGYVSSKRKCTRYSCSGDRDCSRKFSDSNAICHSRAKRCACDENHMLNYYTQKCDITLYYPIGSACATKTHCGHNAICGNQKCRCMMGYVPAKDNTFHCVPYFCSNAADCEYQFGDHTQCLGSNGKMCRCTQTSDIHFDEQTQSCVSNETRVCSTTDDCSYGKVCVKGACRCPFGKDWQKGSKSCQAMKCTLDSGCLQRYPNSKCSSAKDECVCDDFSYLDDSIQECVLYKLTTTRVLIVVFLVLIGVFIISSIFVSCCQWFVRRNRQNQTSTSNSSNSNRRIFIIRTNFRPIDLLRQSQSTVPAVPVKEDLPPNYDNLQHDQPSSSSLTVADDDFSSELPPPTYDSLNSQSTLVKQG